jgi:hypothetical protein
VGAAYGKLKVELLVHNKSKLPADVCDERDKLQGCGGEGGADQIAWEFLTQLEGPARSRPEGESQKTLER